MCYMHFAYFLCQSPVVCVSCLFSHTECREAGEPVAHERVQDERAGLWRPTEDGGEGAERRPPACSSLSFEGQNGGQRHAGHPGARSCKHQCQQPFTDSCDMILMWLLPQINLP